MTTILEMTVWKNFLFGNVTVYYVKFQRTIVRIRVFEYNRFIKKQNVEGKITLFGKHVHLNCSCCYALNHNLEYLWVDKIHPDDVSLSFVAEYHASCLRIACVSSRGSSNDDAALSAAAWIKSLLNSCFAISHKAFDVLAWI